MKEIVDYLDHIEATSKRTEKEAILNEIKESKFNDIAQKVFVGTYDPTVNYNIKDYEVPDTFMDEPMMPLSDYIENVRGVLGGRIATGNKAARWLYGQFATMTESQANIMKRVLARDLKCGIGATTINKVWPGLIYQHPYMRCTSLSEKALANIKFPCYSQKKEDGMYVDIIPRRQQFKGHDVSTIEVRSRTGEILPIFSKQDIEVLLKAQGDMVLQGEVLVRKEDSDGYMDRHESNGYLNSDYIDPSRLEFFVWDAVHIRDFENREGHTPYNIRYIELEQIVQELNDSGLDKVKLIDTVVCYSVDDIVEHFRVLREDGFEGVVIKDFSGKWKDGDSPFQIKVKVVIEIDLKLVGYNLGDESGKHKGKIGSLKLESEDGKLSVSAGSGLKEKDNYREELLKQIDSLIGAGTICKIKANAVLADKDNPGMYTLSLPVFVEFRTDKKVADTLESIQEQERSFVDMLKLIGG